jgi:hypothetical protein
MDKNEWIMYENMPLPIQMPIINASPENREIPGVSRVVAP